MESVLKKFLQDYILFFVQKTEIESDPEIGT